MKKNILEVLILVPAPLQRCLKIVLRETCTIIGVNGLTKCYMTLVTYPLTLEARWRSNRNSECMFYRPRRPRRRGLLHRGRGTRYACCIMWIRSDRSKHWLRGLSRRISCKCKLAYLFPSCGMLYRAAVCRLLATMGFNWLPYIARGTSDRNIILEDVIHCRDFTLSRGCCRSHAIYTNSQSDSP